MLEVRETWSSATHSSTALCNLTWAGTPATLIISALRKTGRAWRLWRPTRVQVPRKRPRKRVAAVRPRPQAPSGPNQVWSYDFVFDRCANGQQLKCLTVTDEFTKEGLAIEVDSRIRSPRVIDVLSRLVSERGAPRFLRSDNGPEFVSRALPVLDCHAGHRHCVDRAGQALAEGHHGKLQRQIPR